MDFSDDGDVQGVFHLRVGISTTIDLRTADSYNSIRNHEGGILSTSRRRKGAKRVGDTLWRYSDGTKAVTTENK